jgi:hypothetical protein
MVFDGAASFRERDWRGGGTSGLGIVSSSSRVAREGRGRGARIMAHDEGLVVVEGAIFVS